MAPPQNAMHALQGELALVVSSMRRNARWAPAQQVGRFARMLNSVQDEQDPLLQAFGLLKQRLAAVVDITSLDVEAYLAPFLAVVRSEVTTGPITGVALASIHKFLVYGIIDLGSPNAAAGVDAIADSVAHVRFVGTDWASDEVVLMRMLQVSRTLISCPVGQLVSNERVVELIQACLRVCFEKVLSELLRKTAEAALADMIQALFARVGELKEGGVISEELCIKTAEPPVTPGEQALEAAAIMVEVEHTNGGESVPVSAGPTTPADPTAFPLPPKKAVVTPYGVPCIKELLRFLGSMINRRDRTNVDPVIVLGLGLLTVALEASGDALAKFPSLMTVVEDTLCRNVFLLLKSDSLSLAAAALRVCFLIFASLRANLKFQLSHFLSLLKTMEYPTYEHREAALDCLLQLCRLPAFWTDVYLNYDCHLYCPDVCADLIAVLAQHAFPDDQRLLNTHITALQALQALVAEVDRPDADGRAAVPGLPTPGSIPEVRERKRLRLEGMELFNDSPKKGLQFLVDKGLLESLSPSAIAAFLQSDPRLDKAKIGEYIGGPKHIPVLEAFITSFDFRNVHIEGALRQFLAAFRLPGEAQIIQRILELFGAHWFATFEGERVVASADVAFVLSYAIIILNVDLHNPKNKNRMQLKDFLRNHRGLNANADFPAAFLEKIYKSISASEIVMPEEQKGELKEDYEWQVLLARGRNPSLGAVVTSLGCHRFDQDLFMLAWRPVLGALTAVFDSSTDDAMVSQVVASLRACANISARFGQTEPFDSIIIALAKRVFPTADASIRSPEDALAVAFGRSARAQFAATVMFDLARRHANFLREGWKNLLECVLQMYNARLLPDALVEAEDLLAPSGHVSLLPTARGPVAKADQSLFSALSSYLLLSGDSSDRRDATADELELRTVARRCVEDCSLPALFQDSKFLHADALTELVKALKALSTQAPAHVAPVGSVAPSEGAAVVFLELLVDVTLWNQDRVAVLWQSTYGHLVELTAGVAEPTLLVRRAVINLLRLARRLLRKDDVGPQVVDAVRILHALSPAVGAATAEHIGAGIVALIRDNAVEIERNKGWDAVLGLAASHCRHDRRAVALALQAGRLVAAQAPLSAQAFMPLLRMTVEFTSVVFTPPPAAPVTTVPRSRSVPLPPPLPPQPERDAAEELVRGELLDLLLALQGLSTAAVGAQADVLLWGDCWQPLLTNIAMFCTDARRPIRQAALTGLQRSLLLPDLERLTGAEWRLCLDVVLFPLLNRLLEPLSPAAGDTEETRMRACTLLCKVFLQHLTVLLALDDFEALWLHLLDFMDRYMHADNSELLLEAVPESLKNMLLVMATAGVFRPDAAVWGPTWSRIGHFLPGLHRELFPALGGDPDTLPPAATPPPAPVAVATSPAPAPAESAAPAASPRLGSTPPAGLAAAPPAPVVAPPAPAGPPASPGGTAFSLHPHAIVI